MLVWTAILAVLACCAQFGQAQLAVTTATLSGTVKDPSGGVLPQASVSLSSKEKGVSRSVTCDQTGHYSFSQLPPSAYTLVIKAKGFKEYTQNGIVLDAGRSAKQDVVLEVGSEVQEVVVTAEASLLNTDNANVSAEVDSKQIVELPLNMRNIYGLITLNSSVSNTSERQNLLGGGGADTDNADQDITFLNFAGGFFGSSAYLLDGNWDQDSSWGGVIYVPSVDSVEEFKIQNNSFTAQYGWSTGNVVNVVTKSGGNAFHGDAYGFYRNSALDANLWFNNHNNLKKGSFNRDQMGASAGGPLVLPSLHMRSDQTFFFGLFEHLALSTPGNDAFTVPNANFLAGNFSSLLGPQNGTDAEGRPIYVGQIYDPRSAHAIVAGQADLTTGLTANRTGIIRDPIQNNDITTLGSMDSVAQKLASYFPKPTNASPYNNYVASATAPAHSNEYMARVDRNVNSNTRAYARFSYKEEFKTGEQAYWGSSDPAGPGNARPNNRWNIALGYSEVFTPTFTVNVAAGAQAWHETSTNQSLGFKPSTLGLPSYLDAHSQEFPIVNIGSVSSLGPASGENVMNHGPAGSIATDFIKLLGRHTLNFGFMGVEMRDYEKNTQQTTLNSYGNFSSGPDPNNLPGFTTGNGLAQFLLGVLDGGNTGIPYNPSASTKNLGWYVQDDWRPTNRLTLNLGFRYELQMPTTYHDNQASVFNTKLLNPISSAATGQLDGALQFLSDGDRGMYNTNYKNFAPRLGFTYQAMPSLVVRGGYGIFYPESIACCWMAQPDGFSASTPVPATLNNINPNPAVSTSNPWPNGYTAITGNALGELQQVGYNVYSNFRQRAAGYVQQYLFGLQWAATPNDSLDVNYVGNHGIHMIEEGINRTQLDPKYLSMGADALNSLVPNPFYGSITNSGCALAQQTVPQYQLLQPYPEYCSVGEQDAPIGFSNYNSLQVTYNHRVNKGLTALVSYTYSKFLDNVEGNDQWSYSGNTLPANGFNMAAEKSVDAGDIPHSLVANYVYQLPIGRGRALGKQMNRATNAVLGGWEVSQIATFKQGIPINITGANIPSFGGNPRPDVVGNVHVSHPSISEWFNTGAFGFAPYGTFGTAPRYFSNLRGPGYQNWDTAIMKNWGIAESMRLQFRAEMFNTFNHAQFYSPSGTSYPGCDPNAGGGGTCPSGFGQITQAFPARSVQLAGKFYW